MNFFVFEAVADTGASYQGSPYSVVMMLLIFSLLFYFIILRPQQQRAKVHKELISSIVKGDEIMTTGGLVGQVVKVMATGYILIALNANNEVIIKRDFIATILPKGSIKNL